MSMECLFQGTTIPIIASAITCLSNINGDFLIQCTNTGITFQVTGLALQSYLTISFDKVLFTNYICEEPFHYGINSKSIYMIFKDTKHIEAVTMKFEHTDIEYNLVFELLCTHKVRKVYHVRLFESTVTTVNYNESQTANVLIFRPELLYKAVHYLQTKDEIIMKVLESSVSIENIPVEGEVRTTSNLNPSDLSEFTVQMPTSLRFLTTVQTFLSVLLFAQNTGISLIQCQFNEGGCVMQLITKSGCEKEGIHFECLIVTSPEDECVTTDSILDTNVHAENSALPALPVLPVLPEETSDKREEGPASDNDEEFWKRRKEDEEEWY